MTHFSLRWLAPQHWPTWAGLGLLFLLAWLPWKVRRYLAKHLGQRIYQKNTKRRQVTLSNLQRCFPHLSIAECEHMAQAHLQEYAHALLNYSLLFFRSRQWLSQHIEVHGAEHLEPISTMQRNAIFLLGHSVWLEFAPVGIGQFFPAYGSYKPFKNPVLNWMIARSRLKDVEFVVAREDGMRKLIKGLQPGRFMIFLPDEDHGAENSVFVPFFQQTKATLTTPARLSKIGRAAALPVMPFFNHQTGKFEVFIAPPLENYPSNDPEQDALAMNQALEQLIQQQPEQYMWLLKIFRTQENNQTAPY